MDSYRDKTVHFCITDVFSDEYLKWFSTFLNNVSYEIHVFDRTKKLSEHVLSVVQNIDDKSLVTFNTLEGVGSADRYTILSSRLLDHPDIDIISSPYFEIKDNLEIIKRQSFPDEKTEETMQYLHLLNRLFCMSNIVFRTSYLQTILPKAIDIDFVLWAKLASLGKKLVVDQYLFYKFYNPVSEGGNTFSKASLSFLSDDLLSFLSDNTNKITEEDIKTHLIINYMLERKLNEKKSTFRLIDKISNKSIHPTTQRILEDALIPVDIPRR